MPKRKLPLEKIQNKDSRAVCFTQRRNGLYSKASEICLLAGAQMPILTTPCSSKSNISFYSFGHSSVDDVVSAFLEDRCLVGEDNLGLGFWWEDEDLAISENSEELRKAIESMSKMLSNLKKLRSDSVHSNQRDHQDDLKKNDIKKKDDLVLHGTQKLDDHQTLNLQSSSAIFDDLPENFNKISEERILKSYCITDQPAENLDGYNNQELDLDQLIDFEFDETLLMNSELKDVSMDLCSGSQTAEDGALVHYRGFDEDNLSQGVNHH